MNPNEQQQEALRIFESLPAPKEKDEAWRYTFIEKIDVKGHLPLEAATVEVPISSENVVVSTLSEAFSSHPELIEKYLGKSLDQKDVFQMMSAAQWKEGLFIHVPANTKAELMELKIKASKNTGVRNLIVVEKGAELDYFETYTGEGDVMLSTLTEVYAEQGAHVRFSHFTDFGSDVLSFNHTIGTVQKDANISWSSGVFGGKVNRLRIDTHFEGTGAESTNHSVFVGKNSEHLDVTTNAYHNVESTRNDMNINGIMKDTSRCVYRGLIDIEKEAQQTNSFLSNNILKISEKAIANSIPALEIDANDVAASHGATIGQIDDEQLFYLQSRGLSQEDAEHLIVQGFLEPTISEMNHEAMQEMVRKHISS